jgi:hypothetical protein
MKILTVSDKVVNWIYSPRLKEKFGDVELVLSCGDLPFYYLEYIVSTLNVPLFYVMGNHDKKVEYSANGRARTAPRGCINIDNRVIQHKGLLIGGLEGSMHYSREPRFQHTDPQMHLKVLQMAPQLFSNLPRKIFGHPDHPRPTLPHPRWPGSVPPRLSGLSALYGPVQAQILDPRPHTSLRPRSNSSHPLQGDPGGEHFRLLGAGVEWVPLILICYRQINIGWRLVRST